MKQPPCPRLSPHKGKYSEIVPKQFQNFTAPLLVTVAKLSLNEEIELVAGECLNRLILNLPPITLVEPIAVLCSNKHDNDELRNIGLTQALKLPKRFKDELQMVGKIIVFIFLGPKFSNFSPEFTAELW